MVFHRILPPNSTNLHNCKLLALPSAVASPLVTLLPVPFTSQLLDAGVVPEGKAIYRMLNHMENNENAGAVAGEMRIRDMKLYNLWSSTQHVQMKMDHLFEKSEF